MKINYTLDSNNNITSWISFPLDPNLPTIDIEDPEDIKIGFDKVLDGIFVKDIEGYDAALQKNIKINNIKMQIIVLKSNLKETDYKLYKYLEGFYTDEEYEPIKVQRQEWREEINSLEEELQTL